MRAKWHRHLQSNGTHEHVLFVGEWEWRVNDLARFSDKDVKSLFGGRVRWRANGPGLLEGDSPTACGTVLTVTLRQAKARCEDAALRVLEACVKDLGMRVVE